MRLAPTRSATAPEHDRDHPERVPIQPITPITIDCRLPLALAVELKEPEEANDRAIHASRKQSRPLPATKTFSGLLHRI